MQADPQSPDFTARASEDAIQKVLAALRANNIDARVVDNGEDAKRMVLELIPKGAEVHSGKSKTLQDAGLFPGALRVGVGTTRSVLGYMKVDRRTEGPGDP